MLKLRGRDGEITLEVSNYEFPELPNNYDDANWLTVHLQATDYDVDWEAFDSCLLTYELAMMRDWLLSIDLEKQSELTFLEGELWLRYLNRELYVYLDFAFHPKGKDYDYANDEPEFYMRFDLEYAVENLIKFIDETFEKYPERLKSERHF